MTNFKLDDSYSKENNATFYISYGSKIKMYTLRFSFDEKRKCVYGEYIAERDWYIQNLSTDKNKAREKAEKFSKVNNIRLLSDNELSDLNEIRRRKSDKVKEDLENLEDIRISTQKEAEEHKIDMIDACIFPFGKWKDLHFSDVFNLDKSYIVWLNNSDDYAVDSVTSTLQNALRLSFPDTIMPKYESVDYFGDVKTRYKNIKALVVADFAFDGYYGMVFVSKLLLDGGELVVYMGGTPQAWDVMDNVVIDFTVKSHEVYKDEIQTKILRIKKHD